MAYSISDAWSTSVFLKYPYIRLMVPWAAGIFCGDKWFGCVPVAYWYILAGGAFLSLLFIFFFLRRYSWRWCFGVAIGMFCFAGGAARVSRQMQETSGIAFPQRETFYRAVITETPEAKENSYLCRVLLKELRDSVESRTIENGKALLYFQQDTAASRLKRGDVVWCVARISPPVGSRNFEEFDYARYLLRKGIGGTGYVKTGKWMLCAPDGDVTSGAKNETFDARLWRRAADSRDELLAHYRRLGFHGDELAVLSALTVGDRTELSESMRESYSVAGVSHLLALSGLHIGLLYALLFYLLKPIAFWGSVGLCLRAVFVVVSLGAFAFFTGGSPSVVRAATMFSLLALSGLLRRRSFSLNILAATAWWMLLYRPTWLFDIGFQLSFVSVAAILLFHPIIYRRLTVRRRWGNYLWQLTSVSLAAQLGAMPLVMFHFSRFSVYFLLTNLVAVPLITFILYSAVLMLVLTPVDSVRQWVAEGVERLLSLLNGFVEWVERLPVSSIERGGLCPLEVIGFYVVLLLLLVYGVRRRYKFLFLSFFSFFLLGVFHALVYWADVPATSVVFYNVRGCPAVHCIEDDGRSWICYADTSPSKKRLNRAAVGYWRRHHLLPPKEVVDDARYSVFVRQQQFLFYHGCRICMVNDNRWQKTTVTSGPYPLDYLYLCKGYDGNLQELTRLFVPACIVLDASLPEYRRQFLKNECRRGGWRCVSLAEEGSVCFPIVTRHRSNAVTEVNSSMMSGRHLLKIEKETNWLVFNRKNVLLSPKGALLF